MPIGIRRVAGATLAWLSAIVLALTFARAGIDKLSAHGGFAAMFEHWGYPAWFRICVGVAEVAAAGLLLWPSHARWGAVIVLVVMAGAVTTRIMHGEAAVILSAELLPSTLALGVILLRGSRPARETSA